MFLMETMPRVLMFVFLFTSMLSIGARVRLADLRSVFAGKALLIRSLLANLVLVPIIGIGLIGTAGLAGQPADTTILPLIEAGTIGLDIKKGSAVENIHAFNVQYGALNFSQADNR